MTTTNEEWEIFLDEECRLQRDEDDEELQNDIKELKELKKANPEEFINLKPILDAENKKQTKKEEELKARID
jgi:hypothetical protein